MKRLSNGALVMLLSFWILFILDYFSTIINGELVHYLEANPLYALTGGLWLIVLLNICLPLILLYWYSKKGIGFRWFVTSYFSVIIPLRLLAVWGNIQAYLNPVTLEVAQSVTTAQKASYIASLAVVGAYIPFIVLGLMYFLFKIDHKIVVKGRATK